jgi:hypothetical protein
MVRLLCQLDFRRRGQGTALLSGGGRFRSAKAVRSSGPVAVHRDPSSRDPSSQRADRSLHDFLKESPDTDIPSGHGSEHRALE